MKGNSLLELLRFATAGSVDDGKSTLIGRLLHDSKAIFEDQLAAVEQWSQFRGHEDVNLALLTDGLRAEREQGITIDVAYRYFATPRRKFIIADTPGHLQYTRNMVTGASTADLAVVLVDARKGVLEQSRRHAFIASLLGIPHVVLAVNKMDLVGWDEVVFKEIVDEFLAFAEGLDIAEVTPIPISALLGDNVVDPSANMPWYDGPTLLHHLEHVDVASSHNHTESRFPVQYVIRDHDTDYRGYAGQVAGGVLHPGDEVVALPGGQRSQILSIDTFEGPVTQAFAPMSITVRLTDEIDISRGDMLCLVGDEPTVSQEVDAVVCWFADRPMAVGAKYGIKHTTRAVRGVIRSLEHRLDINTHEEVAADSLAMNEIGRVVIKTTSPLLFDPYRRNRATGSFILIDEATDATAGAGMILGPAGG
ncbi:MAG: bifunctional enzyme CysN/CysC [Acidimicrobiaceae bacterium]|jgi:bifunctional enzyme CysN/CysC|nr:bifunctional enzyme CysN/CysC [Acidimicrobiaceae bacterium]